jgi:hypothetical protein
MPWYHKDFVTWLATVDENHMIFVFQLLGLSLSFSRYQFHITHTTLDTFCAFANTHNFIPPHQLLAHDSPLSGDLKSYIEDYCQVMARQQTLAGDVEALGRLFFPKDSERLALLTMKNPNAIQADHLPLQPALEPMTAPDTESEDIGLSKDHDKSANVINIRALLSATDHKSWDIVSDEDEFQEIWSAYKEVNDTKASMGHQANQPLGESEWKIHKKELCKAMANVVDIVEDDNNINVGKVRTAANLEIELLACRIMVRHISTVALFLRKDRLTGCDLGVPQRRPGWEGPDAAVGPNLVCK